MSLEGTEGQGVVEPVGHSLLLNVVLSRMRSHWRALSTELWKRVLCRQMSSCCSLTFLLWGGRVTAGDSFVGWYNIQRGQWRLGLEWYWKQPYMVRFRYLLNLEPAGPDDEMDI